MVRFGQIGERWASTGKREISTAVRLGSPRWKARRGCRSAMASLFRSNCHV